MGSSSVFKAVYEVVKKIPRGRVVTYGRIADKLRQQNPTIKKRITPRIVGFALHANKDPRVPCHRVVSKDGRIAKSYALGGARWQKRKLLGEKVAFKEKMQVDLERHQWRLK